MNERSEQQKLLDDMLDESLPADFRAALLDQTLRLARRRRRWRQSRRAGAALCVLFFAVWLAGREWTMKISPLQPLVKGPGPAGWRLVETRPLPAAQEVTTKDFARVTAISSQPTVGQIASSGDGVHSINDAQLLVWVGQEPAVLIRTGPHSEELVFAEPMDPSKIGPQN
jgi:hypothetical protein